MIKTCSKKVALALLQKHFFFLKQVMVPALMLLRGGREGCCAHRCGVSALGCTEWLTSHPHPPTKGLFPKPCALVLLKDILLTNALFEA